MKTICSLDNVYETERKVYSTNLKRIEEISMLIQKSNEERLLGKSPLSESDFNKFMLAWQEEKEVLLENNKCVSKCSQVVYKNIDTIMNFLNNLPNVYQQATVEDKQKLLRMIIERVTYDTETQKMSVKLKPVFQALRIAKQNENNLSGNVVTFKKVAVKTVLDYLVENIDISLKNEVTTLERLYNTEKEPIYKALFINGAGKGVLLEHLSKFFNVVKTEEYQEVEYKLQKLVA